MSQGQGACSEPKMHVAPALPTEVYTIAEHLSVQDTARLIGVCKASSRLRPREKVLKHYYDMLQRNRSGCCEVTLSANSIRSTAASRRQKKRARYKPALIKPPLKRHQRGPYPLAPAWAPASESSSPLWLWSAFSKGIPEREADRVVSQAEQSCRHAPGSRPSRSWASRR